MTASASEVLGVKDRRNQMVLSMAKDAVRVKEKSREARHKKTRQVGYRSVRCQRFKGRRGAAMEEEVRAEVRTRRARSIHIMAKWLELQAQANAEEGTPGEGLSVAFAEPTLEVGGALPEEPVVPGR